MEIDLSLTMFLLANLVVFVAAFVMSSTGLGYALIAVPVLALIDLEFVPGPVLFANLFLAIFMIGRSGRQIVQRELAIICPAIALGTLFGAMLLSMVPKDAIGILFSVFILIAVALTVYVKVPALTEKNLVMGGVLAGMMGTASGTHGPPLAVIYQSEEINKTKATLAIVFLVAYVASLLTLSYKGIFDRHSAARGAALLPGTVIGFIASGKVQPIFSPSLTRSFIIVIVTASAAVLFINSVGFSKGV